MIINYILFIFCFTEGMCVEARGQLLGTSSLLQPHETQGSNSGRQAREQVPLPTGPSPQHASPAPQGLTVETPNPWTTGDLHTASPFVLTLR